MISDRVGVRAMFSGVAAALVLGLSLPASAQPADDPDAQKTVDSEAMSKGEKQLAKLLEGRVAGEPQTCIRTFPNQRMQTINRTAYVYGSGNTIYVQRTRNPDSISNSNTLVTNRFSPTDLCRVDMTTLIDPVTGIFMGAVFFEDFVPYTRVKADAAGEG